MKTDMTPHDTMKCCRCGKQLLDVSENTNGGRTLTNSCSPIEVVGDGMFACNECSKIPQEVVVLLGKDQ